MGGINALTISKSQGGDREVCTEGSETTKFGTDEQKLNMRLNCMSKQAHHCNAQRTPKVQLSRFSSDWMKEYALTRGGLSSYELAYLRSQQKS